MFWSINPTLYFKNLYDCLDVHLDWELNYGSSRLSIWIQVCLYII